MIGSFKYGWFKVDSTISNSYLFIPFVGTGVTYVLFPETKTAKAVGSNVYGQLGDGSSTNRTSLVSVTSNTTDILRNISAIYTNAQNAFFLKDDKTIWGVGNNLDSVLGIGGTLNSVNSKPIQPVTAASMPLVDIIDCKITSNGKNAFFLASNGDVYATGSNNNGQLGRGNTNAYYYAAKGSIVSVSAIAPGAFCNTVLLRSGAVWACGYNASGQLGTGDSTDKSNYTQSRISTSQVLTGINMIKNGGAFVFALSSGSVFSTGINNYGQLGIGNLANAFYFTRARQNTGFITDVKDMILAETGSSYFLKNDGTVWACGNNASGQLGIGSLTNSTSAFHMSAEGNIPFSDAKDIYASYNFVHIVKNDGTVWACGANNAGQLGLGDNNNRNLLTQVKINASTNLTDILYIKNNNGSGGGIYFVKNDGSVYRCGFNGTGQLATGNTTNLLYATLLVASP
jgi:alpha-tubulin suppressor-like RCC1 family protein